MQKLDGTTIKINRGDTLHLALTIKQGSEDYIFQVGDKVVFSIYKKGKLNEEAILLKEITVAEETTTLNINLTNEETKRGDMTNKPIEYWYEIGLNNEYTVIGYDEDGAKKLMLYPEGSKIYE